MNYTPAEITMMKAHTAQIIEYLDGLKPNVRESISVLFHQDKYGGTPHEITLSRGLVYGRIGYVHIKLEPADTNRDARDVFTSTDYMSMLIHNWPTIKARITSEINSQQDIISSITDFTL